MNKEIEESYRYITVIIDPHVKVSDTYYVYTDGIALQDA
jgi:hypothetical protein